VTDAHDQGGDPACWLHLFEDAAEEDDLGANDPPGADEDERPGPASQSEG